MDALKQAWFYQEHYHSFAYSGIQKEPLSALNTLADRMEWKFKSL